MSASDYDMLSLHEQIMLRPDTYVGSYDTHRESRWIWDVASGRMVWREVSVNPALLKIFDEVLVNALDHRVRLIQRASPHPVKHLDVVVSPTRISVRNDGEGIPVEEHPVHKLYAPEMIFGRLLSSSNYNDAKQERIVGGMNGYGAKLANIFSNEFTVETVDVVRQKRYKQTWTRNMLECGKASITKATCKPYTEIAFAPDLSRFKWEGDTTPAEMPADMVAVLCSRVIDAAACAGKDCRVSLNGVPVASNTFSKYVELYLENAETATIAYEQAGERWEIAAMLTRDLHGDLAPKDRHISFVNGINTRRGGKHVDYVSKTIMASFCEMAKKKAKLPDLTPAILKDSVVWFLNTTIVNPAFDTQTKESLTTPVDKFGSLPTVSPKFVDKLAKIGLLEEAQMLMDAKTHRDAKKTDGKKKSSVRGIPKLEDAAWAGTAKSSDCTLILTEGDSAATTAISGLKVVGRDRYGVFPLKGKILNVKDASAAQKTANQELTYIKQILGLEHGKSYTDLSQLRYGRIMIMTDQDVDGSHIKGLLMNLFHTEWPSLLRLGFLCCLMTPLLKATKGAQTLCFYSESEYRAWQQTDATAQRGWKVKYYKGLGTSTAAEAREYFANMNTVEFQWDDATDSSLDLAFNKKRSDDRKEWLTTYDRARTLQVPAGGAKVAYTRFVNDELIHFSIADNARSIPSVMDGLKPSQRKILWSALKRNLVSEIKVAQLAGYVSETAAYHHGEASLMGAIIGMAQNFVGSNNINLLAPNGQFGSRLAGGKDSASPRYIFTALDPIVRSLVRKEDDGILRYVDDDGQLVEPEYYMPVLPMLLVNGAVGIGTGFSTNVPPFNPADLIAVLKHRLSDADYDLSATQLTPWWFGFQGTVYASTNKKAKSGGFTTRGIYEFVDDDAALIRIRELPVGTWTHDYRAFLDDMKAEQEEAARTWAALSKKKDEEKTDKEKAATKPQLWLRDYKNDSNDIDVNFLLEMDPDAYHEARAYPAEFEARFQLTSTFNTTNMVAFNAQGQIHQYKAVGEILDEFYHVRLAAYAERKKKELQQRAVEIQELEARMTFVRAVVEKRLVVAAAEDADLLSGLLALGVPPLSAPDAPQDLRAYEYLLRMRVDRLKASAVQELERELAAARAAYDTLSAMTIEALWLQDLDAAERAWGDFVGKRRAVYEEAAAIKAAPAPKKRAPAKPRAQKTA